MTQEELNPFAIAQKQLDAAAKIIQLDPATHELLRWPLRELHVTLPVKMDDGSTEIFHGFRVQYNDARGPDEGWAAFPPPRDHRHGAGAGRVDDVEDGGDGHSLGRRQGWHHLQPQSDVAG